MAKHPVPKKKQSNSSSAHRYASFVAKKYRKIKGYLNITSCPKCGEAKLNQYACKNCGTFRGRSIKDISKAVSKVTKIKV